MSTRVVAVLDPSEASFDCFAWQFFVLCLRRVSEYRDAYLEFVTKPDTSVLSSPIKTKISWSRMVFWIQQARSFMESRPEASEIKVPWAKRFRSLLQNVLIQFDWNDHENPCDAEKLLAVFTSLPEKEAVFMDGSIKEKLLEHGIKLVIFNLGAREEARKPRYLANFLASVSGCTCNLSSGVWNDFPELESHVEDTDAEPQELGLESADMYLDIQLSAQDTDKQGTQEVVLRTVDEKFTETCLVGTMETIRNEKLEDECSWICLSPYVDNSEWALMSRTEMSCAWKFSFPPSQTIWHCEYSKQLVLAGGNLWIFTSIPTNDVACVSGVAVPVKKNEIPILLFKAMGARMGEDTSKRSKAVSAVPMDSFVNVCIQHLAKIEVKPKTHPKVDKLFQKRFRQGEVVASSREPVSRKEAIICNAEATIKLKIQKRLEKVRGLPRNNASKVEQIDGKISGTSSKEVHADDIGKYLERIKSKAFKLSSNIELYNASRKTIFWLCKVFKRTCPESSSARVAVLQAMSSCVLRDINQVCSLNGNVRAMELKFQTLIRLEAMSLVVKKSDRVTHGKLTAEVSELLSKLTLNADCCSHIKPFMTEVLVKRFKRRHGKLIAELCAQFNVPVPVELEGFLSPVTEDEMSLQADEDSSETSRDSSQHPQDSEEVANGKRKDRPQAFKSIVVPKASVKTRGKKKPTQENSEENSEDGVSVRRNLFGTCQAKPDPVFVRAKRGRDLDVLSRGSPRTPENVKRRRFSATPSPRGAFSVGLRVRTPQSVAMPVAVPDTPESVADYEDDHVVVGTPRVGTQTARQLRFRSQVHVTPSTPILFDDDGSTLSPNVCKKIDRSDSDCSVPSPVGPPVWGSPLVQDCDALPSPALKDFYTVVRRESSRFRIESPARSPVIDDPDAVIMPPPTWTPRRNPSTGKKRNQRIEGNRTPEQPDLRGSNSPVRACLRGILSPVNSKLHSPSPNERSGSMRLGMRRRLLLSTANEAGTPNSEST